MAQTYPGVIVDNLNFNDIGKNISSLTVIISDSNIGADGTYNVEPNVIQDDNYSYKYFGAKPVDTTFTNFITFARYPFCIVCNAESELNDWRLVLPALSVVEKPTLDLSIQIIAHTKETVVSDDFKEVIGEVSGVTLVTPFNGNFTESGLPSETITYHKTSFSVTTSESTASGGNYLLYRQNPSTNDYDIAVYKDNPGDIYWCPLADILLIKVAGASSDIIGTGSIPRDRQYRPAAMEIIFITNGQTSINFSLKILVNLNSLIAYSSNS